jgi:hypothetical protein
MGISHSDALAEQPEFLGSVEISRDLSAFQGIYNKPSAWMIKVHDVEHAILDNHPIVGLEESIDIFEL